MLICLEHLSRTYTGNSIIPAGSLVFCHMFISHLSDLSSINPPALFHSQWDGYV